MKNETSIEKALNAAIVSLSNLIYALDSKDYLASTAQKTLSELLIARSTYRNQQKGG